jgi:hypothetical protein
VLEVVGDQGGTTRGVISINPGAHDITIRDLTIDTAATTNTNEQFNAIDIGNSIGIGTIEDVRIQHIHFEHPAGIYASRKGDCLHIFGNTPQTVVRRVAVIGAIFARCARSNIAIETNVFDFISQGNQFTQPSNQNVKN